jgi:protein pelota
MKILKQSIQKDASGAVQLMAQDAEDLWTLFNLIHPLDTITASTVRKVTSETSTGSTDKFTQRLTLRIRVTGVDYDQEGETVRVSGRNVTESKWIKLGQFHTMDIELNRPFTLWKLVWDSVTLQRLHECTNPAKDADVAAIVMQEGLAHVVLITNSLSITKQRIEVPIPKKRRGSTTNHEKALARFYDTVTKSVIKNIDFSIVKVVIVASPGFVKVL